MIKIDINIETEMLRIEEAPLHIEGEAATEIETPRDTSPLATTAAAGAEVEVAAAVLDEKTEIGVETARRIMEARLARRSCWKACQQIWWKKTFDIPSIQPILESTCRISALHMLCEEDKAKACMWLGVLP